MKKAEMKRINENTWQFTENFLGENVYCYLLTGNRSALLIDTAYGFTDIAGTIKEITDLPLIVVNTHGHFDHVTGNYRFGKAYMSIKDNDLYRIHTQQKSLEELLVGIVGGGIKGKAALLLLRPTLKKLLAHKAPDTLPLPECGYFDLGARIVRIIETPGHTQGSISLLDERNGWLFSGDTCGDAGMLLHFPEGTSAKEFHQTIRTIRTLVKNGTVTRNYPSHQTSPAPLEKLAYYEGLLAKLEKADLTKEEWKSGIVQKDSIRIQFSPEKIKWEAAR